eukprot:CAMPEP_0206437374 /NCGR_PEP_ID=MMETSP0324_2-20121206/11003_1 /ASSEMBLY_ACC=CAM_ASM_000836 /TAXON_ID=2866 /ORGANISM="Crypthecodinium cohnii, Strain Seligo" /LENGTH=165 /DNA_ID=CAMNT_0053904643 /DNA_START=177 /DNA_END=673 /DNA_ORIENTATION=+
MAVAIAAEPTAACREKGAGEPDGRRKFCWMGWKVCDQNSIPEERTSYLRDKEAGDGNGEDRKQEGRGWSFCGQRLHFSFSDREQGQGEKDRSDPSLVASASQAPPPPVCQPGKETIFTVPQVSLHQAEVVEEIGGPEHEFCELESLFRIQTLVAASSLTVTSVGI